jgi:flagellar hook protein FlgE
MLRSMYSGVSGLRGYQTMIDVVGNNIANVNTIGFKGGQTVFQDLLSQTLQGAGLPAQGGGTNPAQIGLGMRLAGTTTNFGQGGLQNTGRPTDLSIQGDGFFIVRRGTDKFYTRAGSFTLDGNGRLSSPQGTLVQGWMASALGDIDTNGPVGDINMPVGTLIDPQITRNTVLGGNLPSSALPLTKVSASITVYDANGAGKTLTFEFQKSPDASDENNDGDFIDPDPDGVGALLADDPGTADLWRIKVKGPITADGGASGYLQLGGVDAFWDVQFDPANGLIQTINPQGGGAVNATSFVLTQPMLADIGIFSAAIVGPPAIPADQIAVNLNDLEPLTQFSGINSLIAKSQDGSAPGALQTFTIATDGTITGVFSNGRTQSIAQIAIANFANPAGLEKLEGSMYRPTANSGLATEGVAGLAGRGTLAGGTLEMSNVDLAQEFTNLIVAQRGFQASTKVISASDEILSDLVNIRR